MGAKGALLGWHGPEHDRATSRRVAVATAPTVSEAHKTLGVILQTNLLHEA